MTQRFIAKKTPEEYLLEENLKQVVEDRFSRRMKRRLSRRLTKVLIDVATCLFGSRPLEKKLSPTQLKRVLILRWDLIGDMILTTPIFNLLKSLQPSVEIDVLASEKNVGVINGDERISQVFLLGKGVSFLKTVRQIRRRRYDLVLSFIQIKSIKDVVLSNLLGQDAVKASAKRKAKYRPFFNVCAKVGIGEVHAVEKFLAVPLAAIESGKVEPVLSIHISETARQHIEHFIKREKLERCVVVNISAGGAHRQWGETNYIAFLKSAVERYSDLQFVILSDPRNIQTAETIRTALNHNRVVVFPTQSDIQVVAALIQKSFCVVSPDTSVVHLASATGRPVLGLYTIIGTVPSEWLPYRVPYRAVLADGRVPISTISVETVLDAFEDLINELEQHRDEVSH